MTAANLIAMCLLEEQQIRSHQSFVISCIPTTYSRRCCRSWSLGNYVALLRNKSSCQLITQTDVEYVTSLLVDCSGYYHNLTLTSMCDSSPAGNGRDASCSSVPTRCRRHNAVYHMIHYLTDIDFMSKRKRSNDRRLRYAMTMLPLAAGIGTTDLFHDMRKENLTNSLVQVTAINFGIKHEVFNDYLRQDMLWFTVALSIILMAIWLYTTSLFLTLMTVLSIFLSLIFAYFTYTMVFEIAFFPFMNLLTVVILIGIGADDVFIYCKVWAMAKHERNVGTLEKIVSDTLKHASLSMFVTSFTTAAAFYSSSVSSITALKCFAVFSGTAIIINFIMMVTWIPAAMVIQEKWCSQVCWDANLYSGKKGIRYVLCKVPVVVYDSITDWARIFFEKLLPCIVVKLRYLWLIIFLILGVCGIVIVLYYPRLKLPSSNEFQVFAQDHPFEVYDFQIKDRFWFEKAAGINVPTMPITVVWGVIPSDHANKLEPFSVGQLDYDEDFNLATKQAQYWLLEFCQKLRASHYYQAVPGIHMTNCFLENFRKFMEQPCRNFENEDRSPCCKVSVFPYEADVFSYCLKIWINSVSKHKFFYQVNSQAGPRFTKDTGKLVGLVVEFHSKQPFSFNYKEMDDFYTTMEKSVGEFLVDAPLSMRKAWFVSHLGFYDLQHSIAQGTPIAIGVSIGISAAVAFLTTLNILISFYAIVSIATSIFLTVASLVLLGWELNILESVTISVAVGLSIDFTLHYGMAYRLSPDLEREARVACATGRMGSPVAMAALTSFLAGAAMMPSTVLAYRKLGIFLMLVMSISWTCATLFYQALLRMAGPHEGFGQFHWPSSDCCPGSDRDHVDKTVYTMSESTLSSSSACHGNSSEIHELEPLTDREQDSPHHHHHRHHPHHNRRRSSLCRQSHSNSNGSVTSSQTQQQREHYITVQTNNNQLATPLADHGIVLKSAAVNGDDSLEDHESDALSSLLEDQNGQDSAPSKRVSACSDVWTLRDTGTVL